MALEVEIFTKNMEVTERIQDYVMKKVGKLDRYLPEIEEARVDLSYVKSARSSTDRQVAQITVRGKSFILRSEERADDIFAAIDTALEKMQRRIERYKGKRNRGRGDGKSAADVVATPPQEEEGEERRRPDQLRLRGVLCLEGQQDERVLAVCGADGRLPLTACR